MSNKEDFQGQLGKYRSVQTADGSWTLWSEAFDEHCHSLGGAKNETIHNYLKAVDLDSKLLNLPKMSILEVGYGTGQGASLTFDQWIKCGQCSLDFVSLEIDEELIRWTVAHADQNSPISQLKRMAHADLNYYHMTQTHRKLTFSLTVAIGDARKTIQSLNLLPSFRLFDAVYQDAFSPKKNPTLWTVEWFRSLSTLCQNEAVLSTYSASSMVRKSLVKAGWSVASLTGFSGKKEGTIARRTGESCSILLAHLQRSPLAPLFDKDLGDKCS